MKETAFDFMTFGVSAGDNDMFVANASKYTPNETIELCKKEYDYLFTRHTTAYGRLCDPLRPPIVNDVQQCGCAFCFGNPEWPDGCYTLVGEGERGAFTVWVIDFDGLRAEPAQAGEGGQDG